MLSRQQFITSRDCIVYCLSIAFNRMMNPTTTMTTNHKWLDESKWQSNHPKIVHFICNDIQKHSFWMAKSVNQRMASLKRLGHSTNDISEIMWIQNTFFSCLNFVIKTGILWSFFLLLRWRMLLMWSFLNRILWKSTMNWI